MKLAATILLGAVLTSCHALTRDVQLKCEEQVQSERLKWAKMIKQCRAERDQWRDSSIDCSEDRD